MSLICLNSIFSKQYTKKGKFSFARNSGTKNDDFTIKNIYYEPHSSKLQGNSSWFVYFT